MGDTKHPPSISSKADLLPEPITFTQVGRWDRRTRLEKCFIALSCCFCAIAAVFIALYVVLYLDTVNSPVEDVCTSVDCLQTAAYLSRIIDESTEPCEDFYRFACGKWIDSHPVPAELPMIDQPRLLTEDILDLMKNALAENDSSPRGIQQARAFFRSCEDTDRVDERGAAPLLNMLNGTGEMLYPTLTPDWADEGWNLTQILDRVGSIGRLAIVTIVPWYIAPDQKNSAVNIIKFDQPTLLMPSRDMYLGPRHSPPLVMLESVYSQLHVLLGADEVKARRDAKDVVDFEVKLANATEPPELQRDFERLYNKMSIRNMSDRYPDVDWLQYLNKEFSAADINLSEDEQVVNSAMSYFDQLFPILRRTPTRTLLNYCMWRIAYSFSGVVSKEIRDLTEKFNMALKGTQRKQEWWKKCVKSTSSKFPDAVGRLFVDRRFSPQAKERVQGLIAHLRAAFREMIQEQDWMTVKTKQAAVQKLDSVNYKIGYPDYLMNNTELNSKTEQYNVTETLFFETTVDICVQNKLKSLRKLRKFVDRNEWSISAATTNAYYGPTNNEIVFPASVLHKPFYSDQFLDALNYGSLGMVIGHELTHGFDNAGRAFDTSGNMKQWWMEEDLERFEQKTKCMVEQYSSYVDPVLNISLNGKLTIGEDIADNGGLKEAYRAYRQMISRRGKEEAKLPALPYNPDQLFFIGFAQTWCSNMREEFRRILLASDYHSQSRYRVLGPLQNNEDFARVFNCPRGSPMNPERKCRVW